MKNLILNRKEKIIITTVDLINEIGIKELSIKEIAKRENVTEASLYKHFQSKDQILFEVLEYYSKYDVNISKTLENNGKSEKENIFSFFKLYSEYFDSYPALTAIMGCYDVLLYEKSLEIKIKEIVYRRTEIIKKLIIEGQKNKNIKDNIKPENLADILLGTFERIIFRWRIDNFEFSLKERTLEIISEILDML